KFRWDPASRIGKAPGPDTQFHRFGHCNGVASTRDTGVHQQAIDTQLHSQNRIRRCSDARIDNERDLMYMLAHDLEIGEVLNAEARPDWRRKRHDRGRAAIDELAGSDQVII